MREYFFNFYLFIKICFSRYDLLSLCFLRFFLITLCEVVFTLFDRTTNSKYDEEKKRDWSFERSITLSRFIRFFSLLFFFFVFSYYTGQYNMYFAKLLICSRSLIVWLLPQSMFDLFNLCLVFRALYFVYSGVGSTCSELYGGLSKRKFDY